MSVANSTFPPLTFTDNNLVDVIRFINEKNIVALHTTKVCRVFHNISFEKPESAESLKNVRVIYLDCNSQAELLADGEWEWYIKSEIETVTELNPVSELRKMIIDQSSVPNKLYITLDD